MNEIAVRTHKGEYYAGDMIYGIVYLKVEDPDKIEKLQLRISGTERCQVIPAKDDQDEDNYNAEDHVNDFLANPSSDKIMEHPMQVNISGEKIEKGTYRIPFQYQLRPTLPGSTNIHSPGYVPGGDKAWDGAITYTIIASALPADLQANQSFICFGSRPTEALSMAYQEETTIRSCFCYDRGLLALTTELDEITYTTGGTARLKILLENKTSEDVKSVKYSLKRTTDMQGWWISKEVGDKSDVASGSILYAQGKQERLTTEAGVDIHKRNLGSAKSKETSRWECDIQLMDHDGEPLPPTTRGKYLKIQYAILVEVSVPRANDLATVIPMQYVLPKSNTQWEAWEPSPWMKDCTLHRAHEKIAVRNSTLESHIYEELP